MRVALEGRPVAPNEPPAGMVKLSVAAHGTLIPDGGGGLTEYVKVADLARMQNYTDNSDEDALDEESADESRVGKECDGPGRTRWSPRHYKKKNKTDSIR